MQSATGQMLYAKADLAALIAGKLSQTEGVEYEVVKEAKGFRVKLKAGQTKPAAPIEMQPLSDALAKVKDNIEAALGVTAAAEPALTEALLAEGPVADADSFSAVYPKRSLTPTQVRVFIDGKPRTFEKKDLLGAVDQGDTVWVKMTLAQAKKWKLLAKG